LKNGLVAENITKRLLAATTSANNTSTTAAANAPQVGLLSKVKNPYEGMTA
jgi:hypothetical protein